MKSAAIRDTLITLLTLSCCAVCFSASPEAAGNPILMPILTGSPPRIDGRLDETIWQTPQVNDPFRTYNPTYGEQLPHKTEVSLAYDENNIYFAFRCYDSEPEMIKTAISQRDRMFDDDWVGLSLDAVGNKQSAYDLFVNPSGIQGDILNSAVSGEDVSPDFVWESAGQVTDTGYEVEISIPLRSIRFKSGPKVRMGVLFWRRISRLGTSGSWPEIKPGQGLFNVYAEIEYSDLQNPMNLEFLPSLTYSHDRERRTTGSWHPDEQAADFGIGAKYSLTSSTTAEFTYNPDFSQVESDAFQVEVNRRYPNFYSEKRPFFMEGLDILDFAIISHGYMITPVHTRKIADPRWGTKLTGTSGKTTYGVLAAGDELPGYSWEDDVNPHEGHNATFAIARGKRSLGGDSYFGALYSGQEFAGGFNRVLGMDGQYRFFANQHTMFSIMRSISADPEENEDKNGIGINWNHSYSTRKLTIAAAFEHYNTGFEMESAFLRRNGIYDGWLYIGPNIYPDSKKYYWLRRISPQIIFSYLHDMRTGLNDPWVTVPLEFYFVKQGHFAVEWTWEKEGWQNQSYEKTTFATRGQIQMTNWLHLSASITKGDQIYYSEGPGYIGKSTAGEFGFVWQPNARLKQSMDFSSEIFKSNGSKVYSVNLLNSRTTYQFNKYFFIRAILQYNSYSNVLLTDFLASFTFIPGTVMFLGYGSIYEHPDRWDSDIALLPEKMYEMRRSLFLKASYLWRP